MTGNQSNTVPGALRQSLGVSQREIARLTGFSSRLIGALERGEYGTREQRTIYAEALSRILLANGRSAVAPWEVFPR